MDNIKENQSKREGRGYLPQHILHDILVRLPTKSLLRFKTVCKNWCTMISQPDFEQFQLQRCLSKILIVYHFSELPSSYNLVYKLEDKGMTARKYAADLQFGSENNLVARKSCDSLILLHKCAGGGRLIFVYDIISHQKMSLPCIPASEETYATNCSLVYDASIKQHKVVVFLKNHSGYMLESCHICTLNNRDTDEWRMLNLPLSERVISSATPVAVGGVLYWIAGTTKTDGLFIQTDGAFVQPIDIATEELMGKIEVPCRPNNLLEMKGSLCLMNQLSFDELDIWVLKSVWIKQHKISDLSKFSPEISPKILNTFHFWLALESCNSTTYLLVSDNKFRPSWYNLNTEELTPIAVDEYDGSGHLCTVSVLNNSKEY